MSMTENKLQMCLWNVFRFVVHYVWESVTHQTYLEAIRTLCYRGYETPNLFNRNIIFGIRVYMLSVMS